MLALIVTVPPEDEDDATTALWEAGTVGIEVVTSADAVELRAYFDEAPGAEDLRGLPSRARMAPSEVPCVDWVARFRQGFRRSRVGRFLLAPVWENERPADGVILVDPGRAFGTGTHETTRLCLGQIEEIARRRPLGRCLDLGCGTGLLAVAAARLGGCPVVASDLDPDATASAALHSRLNQTPLAVVRADGARGFRPRAFDLVLANLTAPLLLERAQEIGALLAPGGTLVLSGFLLDDQPEAARAYAALGPTQLHTEGEWCALVVPEVRG
jgi:ribosomal protein L11 methyltransferase